MPKPQLGYFFPISAGHPGHPLPEPPNIPGHPLPEPPEPGEPGHPLPPLPPGFVMPPIAFPPSIENPIVIPGTPENPITVPPGTIWPPIPPEAGIAGMVLALVWIVGVGYRWIALQGPSVWPPVATPKQ